MTFEEWQKTKSTESDTSILDNHFGYTMPECQSVLVYDPGVIACMKDGSFFTHIGRQEYAGTLAEVERCLWDDYAKQEVGDAGTDRV